MEENKLKVQLMELDLLSSDFDEKPVKDCCKEIEVDPKKATRYRGTLMATIFLPKHTHKINVSKPEKFENFCDDQLVLFLYKSNTNKSRSSAQYSGDSF